MSWKAYGVQTAVILFVCYDHNKIILYLYPKLSKKYILILADDCDNPKKEANEEKKAMSGNIFYLNQYFKY